MCHAFRLIQMSVEAKLQKKVPIRENRPRLEKNRLYADI